MYDVILIISICDAILFCITTILIRDALKIKRDGYDDY